MVVDPTAPAGRRIALIAHDNKKRDMLEWAKYNLALLRGHELFATATTGRLLQEQLGLQVTCFRSGPFGGDQQIGARIAEGEPPDNLLDPGALAPIARSDLREALHAIGVAVAAGDAAPAPEVARLAKEHAACVACAQLTPDGGRYVWSWMPREAPVEALLGPIALSALATLGQADLTRVKRCEGEKCGWLFFDTTKNKSRRWCEMEICGNRAKQKRLGERLRGGG